MIPTTVVATPLRGIVRPTIDESPANRRIQSAWLRTTTLSRPIAFSSSVNVRPRRGATRRMGKRLAVTRTPCSRSGSPRPVRLKLRLPWMSAMSSNALFWARQSRQLAALTAPRPSWGLKAVQTLTSRSGSPKGRGRSRTPCTTLNIAVVAPMPNASVTTAAAVKVGCLRSVRPPRRRFWPKVLMISLARRARAFFWSWWRSQPATSPMSPKRSRAARSAASGVRPRAMYSRERISRWNWSSSSTSAATSERRKRR